MAIKWTKEQADAISFKGDLAVSAGAGSGKTAVLVEKIIRLISKENVDLDEILVVTFTKAATADVKEKITSALYALIAEDTSNRHLQKQVTKVENSSIDTIDAFCLKIVRHYFDRLDIPCNFRTLDDNESQIVRDEVMETCIDEFYEKCFDQEWFKEVVEQLCGRRGDDGLKKAVKALYNVLETCDDEKQFKENCLKRFDPDDTYFEDTTAESCREQLQCAENIYKWVLDTIAGNYEKTEKLERYFENLIEKISILKESMDNDIFKFFEKLSMFNFGTLRFPTDFDDVVKTAIKQKHTLVKTIFKKMGRFAVFTPEDLADDKAKQRRMLSHIFNITERFYEMLMAEKNEMAAFDFSDIEKFALELFGGVHASSDAAYEIGNEYKYIFVDEYQDTNRLQDKIFRLITKGEASLFVVGDIKQSIYGFRSAEPEIFASALDKKKALYLNANFRSRKKVVDSINCIFENVMTGYTGGVDYNDEQKLIFGASYYDDDGKRSELHIVIGDESSEFEHIAEIIKGLISEENYIYDKNIGQRRLELKDIAILMRSPKRSSSRLEKKLAEHGIPAYSDTQPVFFTNEEIILATSMLSVIDNPTQDIMLASVLMSPIAGLSADELAEMRGECKEGCLYEALKNYAKTNEKAEKFVEKLEQLRILSLSNSVAGMLTRIYDTFNFMSIASGLGNAGLRKTNLRLLLEYAANYEKTGFKGIFNFNIYLRKIREADKEMSGAKAFSENSNVVRIMSIHRSKGLEYPVVIIAQASKQYNSADLKTSFLINRKYGAAFKMRDTEKSIKFNTLQSLCLEDLMSYDLISEEIRLWYVAMTRAKEKLIITSSCAKIPEGKGITSMSCHEGKMDKWEIRNMKNPLSLIYNTLKKYEATALSPCETHECECITGVPWDIYYVYPKEEVKAEENTAAEQSIEVDEVEVKRNLKFKYPYSRQKGFPSKTSVSSIKKLIELKKDEKASAQNLPEIKMQFERPSFIMRGTKLSAAEMGTAMHVFLQYADFSRLSTAQEVQAEIKRILEKEYITEIQAESLDIKKIVSFGNSDTLRKAVASNAMERERRFNIKVDVGFLCGLTDEKLDCAPDSLVVMQGVIDCMYESDDGYTILDYKTDRNISEDMLRERYAPQLKLYAYALKEITGCKNIKCVIYSFYLEKEIIV